jgi:hypothetical protein
MTATETYHDTASGDARTASDVICLAATPVFAVMALATAIGGDMPEMPHAVIDASPVNGMTAMYVLMSVFHAAPWLKLFARQRGFRQIQHS